MSLNFCKGCQFYYIKKDSDFKYESCMIGILPNLEKNREDCLRNQRNRQISKYCGNILLSIKPKYAKLIFDHKKLIEFRKKIWNNKQYLFIKAIIYESSPLSKITGEFTIGLIDNDDIIDLWEKYSTISGLNEIDFRKYYGKIDKGYAIEILNPKKYQKPYELSFSAPQNFIYLTQKHRSLLNFT